MFRAKFWQLPLVFILVMAAIARPCLSGEPKLSSSQYKSLVKCIDAFWGAWKQRDFETAATFVSKEQRLRFMHQRKFPVRGWKLDKVEPAVNGHEAKVTVLVERFEPVMGSYFSWRHVATWIEVGKKWYLRLPEMP
jgi:hypothetical protein